MKHADEVSFNAPDPATAAAASAAAIRMLEARSDLCHALNRLNEAIDVETDLIDRHRYADDRPATARALARLGSTLVAANRPDRAEVYLTEADGMFQALDDPAMATSHVSTLERLATVFKHRGRSAEAMQCEQRAHALRAAIPCPAGQNVNSTSC